MIPTGAERESGSFSVFSEVNYNYAGKYMASASFRTDGSTNSVRIIAMEHSIHLVDHGLFLGRLLWHVRTWCLT